MTHGILNPASQERTGFFVGWKTGLFHHRNFDQSSLRSKRICGDFPSSGEPFGKQRTPDALNNYYEIGNL